MEVIPGLAIESDITLIGQGTRIQGNVIFDRFSRIHGEVHGNVTGVMGSFIVVGETGSIHGEIKCDEITVDGFVHGDIHAKTKVTISESGRLVGNVTAPQFVVKFGAHFEGRAITKNDRSTSAPSAPSRALNPSKA